MKLFDYSKYEKTGNIAIDMVAECMGFYAKRGLEPAKIELKPHYYDMMRKGIEVLAGKELNFDGGITFEKVPIERGSIMMLDNLRPIFYGNIPKGLVN